jgi:hypothetical protein
VIGGEEAKNELTKLKAAVRESQPIKVGGHSNDAMKENFLRWAAGNLSPGDLHRLTEIDRTYRDTAVTLGPMKSEQVDEEDLDTAMKRWTLNNPE